MVSIESFSFTPEQQLNLLLILYPILGAGIKYIDAAYDEHTFSKQSAFLLSPLLGGLWVFAMMVTDWSSTILLAVLIGVFIKGKIDNKAHIFGFISIIILTVLLGIIPLLFPLLFLSAASILDEVGHDIIGYNGENFHSYRFRHQFSFYFFGRRYLMKVAIIYLVLIGLFPLESFLAFLFFDEAYIIMSIYSNTRSVRSKKFKEL
jgi:hypothetical protein